MIRTHLSVNNCSTERLKPLLFLSLLLISFTTRASAQQALITASDRLPAPNNSRNPGVDSLIFIDIIQVFDMVYAPGQFGRKASVEYR
jgi:hypothetical protein